MTTTRKRNNEPPALSDLEGAINPVETPGIMPPPGTPARVRTTTDYEIYVSPNQQDTNAFSDDLRQLAGEEEEHLPLPEPPTDPLSEFCRIWQNYVGYLIHVTRLPDPANKRGPGKEYNNTCWEITSLGSMPFDPLNIVPQLQSVNGNSGGVFRLFLVDDKQQPIPGARVDRVLIPDPLKVYNQRPADDWQERERYYRREVQPPPALPQKSETELYIEQMQRELFQKVMMRALDPPAPPPPPDPLSALPADTRLALGLLEKGDLLETAVNRIANLAQAPDRLSETPTWKDKLADAGVQLVTQNPQIITTVTDIISRATVAITQGLANAFAPRQAQIINEPMPVTVQHPPAQRAPAPVLPRATQQAIPGLPETPQDDETDNPEDIEIDMMEDITRLLLSEKPLSLDDPVIVSIREEYPAIFDAVMAGIANMPSMSIIQYLCAKSDFCADMFQSSVTGPHLRARLEEFKRLLTQPQLQPNAAPNTAQPEENIETEPA